MSVVIYTEEANAMEELAWHHFEEYKRFKDEAQKERIAKLRELYRLLEALEVNGGSYD